MNNERKETRAKINDLEQKKEINIQPEQNEETRNQKNEERLRNLWNNIQIRGVSGEEEEQDIENLFEQIMKKNCPQSGEGNRFPRSSGSSENPQKVGPKEAHTKAHHNYITKIKDKEKILKASREKKTAAYKEVPIRLSADFSKETLHSRRGWKEVFRVMKGKDLHPRLLYPAKLSFRMEGQIKCFPDNVKLKEFIITQPL